MFRFLPAAALFVAVVLAGCDALTYSPSGENAVEVGAPGPVTIDLRSAPDTVAISGTVEVRYAVSEDVVEVRVYLGDREVATTRSAESVRFGTRGVPDGTYPLRVVAVTGSGTGSLGDRLGTETVETVAERVAIVDNADPEGPAVTFAVEGGLLAVWWTPSRWPTFDRYTVYRDGRPVATIADRETTSWVDSAYVGGYEVYRVVAEAPDREASGQASTLSFPTPRVRRAEPVGDGEVRVTWTATPFTATFEAYVLRRTSTTEPVVFDETVVRAVADTVLVDRPSPEPFGVRYDYSVQTRPGRAGYSTGSVRTWAEPSLGVRPTAYLADADRFVGPAVGSDGRYALRALDGRTLAVVASVAADSSTRAFATPSGDRLFTTAGAMDAVSVVERDPRTLAPLRSLSLADALGPSFRVGDRLYLADGGLLYFEVEERRGYRTYGGRGVGVWDLASGAFEGVLEGPAGGGLLDGATADGRFVRVLHSGEQSWFERTGPGAFREFEVAGRGGVVVPGEGTLARLDGATVTVRRLPDGAEVGSFRVDSEIDQLDVDGPTGLLYGTTFSEDRVLTGAPELVVAYDPATGAEAGRRLVAGESRGVFGRPRVLGGRLWWDGRTRPLAAPDAL